MIQIQNSKFWILAFNCQLLFDKPQKWHSLCCQSAASSAGAHRCPAGPEEAQVPPRRLSVYGRQPPCGIQVQAPPQRCHRLGEPSGIASNLAGGNYVEHFNFSPGFRRSPHVRERTWPRYNRFFSAVCPVEFSFYGGIFLMFNVLLLIVLVISHALHNGLVSTQHSKRWLGPCSWLSLRSHNTPTPQSLTAQFWATRVAS